MYENNMYKKLLKIKFSSHTGGLCPVILVGFGKGGKLKMPLCYKTRTPCHRLPLMSIRPLKFPYLILT